MIKGYKKLKGKRHLFSLTRQDFVMQVFRAGGKGGTKQNKTSSGVRIIHPDSGARGESRRERSQPQNKKIAFRHLTSSSKFKKWLRIKTAEVAGDLDGVDQEVEGLMVPMNLKVERRVDGRWEKF